MTFAFPAALLALVLLPLLWWLLRATPPAPRVQSFPAIRLLAGLRPVEETPARTPPWLLLLRLLAAALVVVGLAAPVLDADRAVLPGRGAVLLVLDDGWDAAADWGARLAAARTVLARAGRAGRPVALLATARDEADQPPRVLPAMPEAELSPRLSALRPRPWPADRVGDASALRAALSAGTRFGAVQLLAGPAAQPEDAAWHAALREAGPVAVLAADPPAARLLLPPRLEPDRLVLRLAALPTPVPAAAAVLAEAGDGRVLARVSLPLPAGAAAAEAPLPLPTELRNELTRLVLEGPPSAGGTVLLDERFRRRPVGLVSGGEGSETPLTGALFFLERALAPTAELRRGTVAQLLARPLSVLVLADGRLSPADHALVARWVSAGGLLLRFAGPLLAEDLGAGGGDGPIGGGPAGSDDAGAGLVPSRELLANSLAGRAPPARPDASGAGAGEAPAPGASAGDASLVPVPLLAGDRQLGGAMSWSRPEGLAPFPSEGPFAGLSVPAEVTVSRQVLARPDASLAAHTWARLADGTPLVTEAGRGRGRVVLFHVTANTDWSSLPLSDLFVQMLGRLVLLSAGVSGPGEATPLAPAETLDGFGVLGPPPPAARALPGTAVATTAASPQHPPGLYGPEADRQALNLSATLPPLRPATVVPGAGVLPLSSAGPERALGPWLVGAAVLLLGVDLLLGLALRGLLRPAAALALLGLLVAGPVRAAVPVGAASPAATVRGSAPVPLRGGFASPDPSTRRQRPLDPAGGLRPIAVADTAAVDLGPVPEADRAALATHLAYVVTGDAAVDERSRQGLLGLSAYVNARTAAVLADPLPVVPGQDELAFFPLLYWPVTADAAPSPAATAALNDYMARGGTVLIDTQGGAGDDGGSGAGFAPDAPAALKRATAGLSVPPLVPLGPAHVLSRAFYLLDDYPGRFDGAPVWVSREQDRSNDSVSPVVIGSNDWASAWAVDAAGRTPYATLPGGGRQRTLAYRFGTNLVIYALTGNYKGDQVHVPAILERLGQ